MTGRIAKGAGAVSAASKRIGTMGIASPTGCEEIVALAPVLARCQVARLFAKPDFTASGFCCPDEKRDKQARILMGIERIPNCP